MKKLLCLVLIANSCYSMKRDRNESPSDEKQLKQLTSNVKLHKGDENLNNQLLQLLDTDTVTIDQIRELLAQGAEATAHQENGTSALHKASQKGYLTIAELLLNQGANVTALDNDNCTPLHRAASEGHSQVCKLLLDHQAPINSTNNNGETALYLATTTDELETPTVLINYGAQIDLPDIYGITPLSMALHVQNTPLCRLLLSHGADISINAQNTQTQDSSLHKVLHSSERLSMLINEYNVDPNTVNGKGETPLMLATYNLFSKSCSTLIDCGANIHNPHPDGRTLLHMAVLNIWKEPMSISYGWGPRGDNTETLALLCQKGASVNAKNRSGQTPLHVAARIGSTGACTVLLKHHANVNALTDSGYSSLHIAASAGDLETCKVLMAHKANLFSTTEEGFTPLHGAIITGQRDICRYFIEECGMSPDCKAPNIGTCLHLAASQGQTEMGALLLELEANSSAVNEDNITPLHLAAQGGHLEFCELLIKQGAPIDPQDNDGNSPLFYAGLHEHRDICRFLQNNGANIELKNNSGEMPLTLISRFFNEALVYKIIQNNNSDELQKFLATVHGDEENTWLHAAAANGLNITCELLLKCSIPVNHPNRDKDTALHAAARNGHASTCLKLIEHGADIEARNSHGLTPIYHAVVSKDKETCLALINNKAQVNVSPANNSANSPLAIATVQGNADMCKFLLDHQATVLTAHGTSFPLHNAAKLNHESTVDALITHSLFIPALESSSPGLLSRMWQAVNPFATKKVTAYSKIISILASFKKIAALHNVAIPREIIQKILTRDEELADDLFSCLLPRISRLSSKNKLHLLSEQLPQQFKESVAKKIYQHTEKKLLEAIRVNQSAASFNLIEKLINPQIFREKYQENITNNILVRIGYE